MGEPVDRSAYPERLRKCAKVSRLLPLITRLARGNSPRQYCPSNRPRCLAMDQIHFWAKTEFPTSIVVHHERKGRRQLCSYGVVSGQYLAGDQAGAPRFCPWRTVATILPIRTASSTPIRCRESVWPTLRNLSPMGRATPACRLAARRPFRQAHPSDQRIRGVGRNAGAARQSLYRPV